MAIRAKHVKSSKNVSRQVDLRKNKLVFNIPKTMQICHPLSGCHAGKANHHPCLFVFLQVSLEQTSPSWKKRIVTSTVVSCLYLWYLLHWPLSWSTSESKLLSKYISMIMFDKLVPWTYGVMDLATTYQENIFHSETRTPQYGVGYCRSLHVCIKFSIYFQFWYLDCNCAMAQEVHLVSVQLIQYSRGYQLVQKSAVVHHQMMILQQQE